MHINDTEGIIVLSSTKSNSSFFKQDESQVQFVIRYEGNTPLTSMNNNTSLKQISNDRISNLRNALTGFHIYDSRPMIFHGNSAFVITYSFFDPIERVPVKVTNIITFVNNREFDLYYYGESSWFQHYLPIVQDLLNSFEFRP